MPEPCVWCGFVHNGGPERCPEQLALAPNPTAVDITEQFVKHYQLETQQPVEQAETEPENDMGLLTKYKPRKDTNNFKQFKRRDFLKKEHFPNSGVLPATIIELRESFEGSYSDMLLDVKCGKVEYTVGIKNDSVLLDQLVNALGQDEKKWRNKQVTFELAKDKYINLQREKASGNDTRRNSKSKSKR